MLLYKYRGNLKRDFNSLVRNEIWAPVYSDLNDPFEALCTQSLKDQLYLDQLSCIEKSNLSRAITIYTEVIKNSGIYSLSKDVSNEILWSLYADSHKGFCIEYDTEILLDMFSFNRFDDYASLMHVFYTTGIPNIIEPAVAGLPSGLSKTGMIATKSRPWEYEKEIRIVFKHSGKIEYDHRAVKGIYFGMRMTQDNIMRCMKDLAGRNIHYYQMEMRTDRYELFVKKIEDPFKTDVSYVQSKIEYDDHLLEATKNQIDRDKFNLLLELLRFIAQIPNIVNIKTIELVDKKNLKLKVLTKTTLLNQNREFLIDLSGSDYKIV